MLLMGKKNKDCDVTVCLSLGSDLWDCFRRDPRFRGEDNLAGIFLWFPGVGASHKAVRSYLGISFLPQLCEGPS